MNKSHQILMLFSYHLGYNADELPYNNKNATTAQLVNKGYIVYDTVSSEYFLTDKGIDIYGKILEIMG